MRKKKEPQNLGLPNKVFAKITPMPKADWEKENLISYSFFASPFGEMVVASLPQGVCYAGCVVPHEDPLQELHDRFPKSILRLKKNRRHEHVEKLFAGKWRKRKPLLLYLKGTDFQLKVWDALLEIPTGALSTYGKIAAAVGSPKAQRAAGSAIGRNPILYIVPCHRVIAQNGKLGGFYWGIEKKLELLNVENAGYLHFTS